ncbi:hypothetical protein NC651_011834 [Populus alba x Populus x berolinensis]|nr:hypothetical protein NC651_011834 [Populus alba x Populus x berolinensis]
MKRPLLGEIAVWQRSLQQEQLPLYFWVLGPCSCYFLPVFMSKLVNFEPKLCSAGLAAYDEMFNSVNLVENFGDQ